MNSVTIWRAGAVSLRFLLVAITSLLVFSSEAGAQASTATLVGTVVDSTGAVLPGADIVVVQSETLLQRRTVSASDGSFVLASLPPGRYTLRGALEAFSPAELRDIVLHVEDRISVKVELSILSKGESVTVYADASTISTSSSVGTVIDRKFVENLPLNGRSLQSLLELTPGVLLTPAGPAAGGNGGQFSVNGQRSNANSFFVDGVSANAGVTATAFPVTTGAGQGGSGQLPTLTAVGTTASLVSVDALQEFRIQTSSYAAEYGRTPGGQISFVTRSGANTFHGSFADYVRHDALDAVDWFIKNRGLPEARMRQHNIGGVLGGPLLRNRAFFFASYEGLRLERPRAGSVNVPSLEWRQTAIPQAQPFLNMLPLPNGQTYADGTADFVASWSEPSHSDATSVRIDNRLAGGLTLFSRLSYVPSFTEQRQASILRSSNMNSGSVTLGSTWVLSNRLVGDFRFNYSRNHAPYVATADDFGGATPPPANLAYSGRSLENGLLQPAVGTTTMALGLGTDVLQRSLNVIGSVTAVANTHEWKFGLDFRRVSPLLGNKSFWYESFRLTQAALATGRALNYQLSVRDSSSLGVVFDTLSVYVQDQWRPTPRLTVTYGVRWEHVPPPSTTSGQDAVTLEGLDDPYAGRVRLAPAGTPLWKTKHGTFAPRGGASYVLSQRASRQLVLKAGFGKFYDLGYGQVANGFARYPFTATKTVASPAFPILDDLRQPPVVGVDPPTDLWVMDPNLKLPFTWQWNVSAEQNLGDRQSVTLTFVGAEGLDLLKMDRYVLNLLDWPAARTQINVDRNRGYSDYRALQVQYQRRLSRGVQAVASYTFGRARDTVSTDFATTVPSERLSIDDDFGYSDFDVRHTLTTAVTWDVPSASLWRPLTSGWSFDLMFRTRSAFPVSVTANVPFPPDTYSVRPNVVPGQPIWIDDTSVPSNRRINKSAFTVPATGTQGDLSRGAVRGFNANQVDLAVRREFVVVGNVRLQLKVEMFNLFNTSNFGPPISLLAHPSFGTPNEMLNNSLGGLNGLYQIGGPRSTQVSAKVRF